MRHLHLILQLPEGLGPESWEDATTVLPSLRKLLARGRPVPAPPGASEALCQALGLARQQDWPVAPLGAKAAGLDADNSYWLRLDPVHLDVSMHGLFLRAEQVMDEAEAAALHAVLAPILAAHGLEVFPGSDGALLVRCPTPLRLMTTPLDIVAERQPTRFLPTGEDAALLTRLLNEAQMALHEHPLNQARATAGRLPINSLWPWGGGKLELPARCMDAAWGNAPLLRTMATALEIAHSPLPGGLDQVVGQLIKQGSDRGLVLLQIGAADGKAEQGVSVQSLERNWLRPLLSAQRLGRLRSARLSLAGGARQAVVLRRIDAWRFWA